MFYIVHKYNFKNDPLAPATGGQPYSYIFKASEGYEVYNFAAEGSLPAGLALSAEGILSGTPTTAGTYNFRIKVIDINNSEAGTVKEIYSDYISLTITTM